MQGKITNDAGEEFIPNLENGLHGLDDISDMVHVILRNDFEADPYGATMSLIAVALAQGFQHTGAMSEGEYENLKTIEELVRQRDNV
jgi:hypothetical protein